MTELTICIHCKHVEMNRTSETINLYVCKATAFKRKEKMSFVTGTVEREIPGQAISRLLFSGNSHPPCSSINTDGACPYFEKDKQEE